MEVQTLEIRNIILEYIENDNLFELKNYISVDNINLKNINNENFDLLIYAIKKDASINIIQYIVQQCEYKTLNYTIKENGHEYSPLLTALSKNKYEISDFLIENKADINYPFHNVIGYLKTNNNLNKNNLKYILNKGYKVKNITTDLIESLIKDSQNEFLEIILKYYKYNQNFILKLLNYYNRQKIFRNINDKKNTNDINKNNRDKLINYSNNNNTNNKLINACEIIYNEFINDIFTE